jgi:hypothetical protein
MALFEDELFAMFEDGESLDTIGVWFMRQIVEKDVSDGDLSDFELRLARRIVDGYIKWKRERKLS